ncbi:hypothetical protein C7S18_06945 [Ahniella affigens]|uniref:Uncharacterized protein n=1 Tax=Ahniella affigens TaxID=2021234 RepID=A0A2P1PQ38_9GAMM|nr:hypothetical protein C7S18_06945 [Ahniella affigens]
MGACKFAVVRRRSEALLGNKGRIAAVQDASARWSGQTLPDSVRVTWRSGRRRSWRASLSLLLFGME